MSEITGAIVDSAGRSVSGVGVVLQSQRYLLPGAQNRLNPVKTALATASARSVAPRRR